MDRHQHSTSVTTPDNGRVLPRPDQRATQARIRLRNAAIQADFTRHFRMHPYEIALGAAGIGFLFGYLPRLSDALMQGLRIGFQSGCQQTLRALVQRQSHLKNR